MSLSNEERDAIAEYQEKFYDVAHAGVVLSYSEMASALVIARSTNRPLADVLTDMQQAREDMFVRNR